MKDQNLPTDAISSRLRVIYDDTDAMGIVYHANYLPWLEIGRDEYLRAHGYSYREMENDGVHLLVADTRVRFRAPARYDDPILINTWLQAADDSHLQFVSRVSHETSGQLLVEAETGYAFTDRAANPVRVIEYPAVWDRLKNAIASLVTAT